MTDGEVIGKQNPGDNRATYNCYVKMTEGYGNALRLMPESLGEARDSVEKRYAQIDKEKNGIDTEMVNASEDAEDGNELYYSVLYRLNMSADIESCKKAAAMLKEYLMGNPGSVMGETLLDVIEEQFED